MEKLQKRNLLHFKSIGKSFHKKVVLKNVNLTIQEGKFYGLLGHNGAGKSTLMRLMSGVENYDDGEALYGEKDFLKINSLEKANLIYISDKIELPKHLKLKEFINVYKDLYKDFDICLFNKIILDRKLNTNKYSYELSKGQQLQYILALALCSNAKIIFIDEATAFFDVYARKYFMDLLLRYVADNKTIVLATNVVNEIQNLADHIIYLKDNSIKLNAEVSNLVYNFVKIRRTVLDTDGSGIFQNKECFWAGTNQDRSVSYIVPKSLKLSDDIIERYKDKRKPNLEDIFVYYFNYHPHMEGINDSDEDDDKENNETAA